MSEERKPCPRCGGSGFRRCNECRGTGELKDGKTCHQCGGGGEIPCECGGQEKD